VLLSMACGGADDDSSVPVITVDGFSTVFPIAEAVAEEYQLVDTSARVTVGVSGVGSRSFVPVKPIFPMPRDLSGVWKSRPAPPRV